MECSLLLLFTSQGRVVIKNRRYRKAQRPFDEVLPESLCTAGKSIVAGDVHLPPMNYIFIDFENVQPKNVDVLVKHPFQIFVFVGERQTKVPFETANALQKFGNNAKYVKIAGNGPNALDFHIALYRSVILAGYSGLFSCDLQRYRI
ncbi:MAG: PIN domain-containing protein [Candidatus Electrothrix sp. YB6]